MSKQLRPLPNEHLSIPRANVLMGDVGGSSFDDVGDVESFNLSVSVEEAERYGKNSGMRQLRGSTVIQVDASITFEAMDMTKFMRKLSVGAGGPGDTTVTQTSQTAVSHSITGVMPGKIYKLPHRKISGVMVDDGAGTVPYEVGADVIVLEESGYIQVNNIPESADSDITVTYDAAEITADDDHFHAGVGSDFNVRKQIHVLSINDVGPRDLLVLHDVQLRPDGDKAMIGDDDYASLSITGRVFVDETKSAGFQLGYLEEIAPSTS